MEHTVPIFFAGLMAGIINSLAGGGSFITLPVLVFSGLPSVYANASSTVALFPGSFAAAWAFRSECRAFTWVPMKPMIGVSLAGGFVGALLLYTTPTTTFDKLIPWLLALGTVAFAFGPRAGVLLRRVVRIGPAVILVGQALLAVYGGYFGGAVGIMMMAAWSLLGITDLKTMNGTKTLLVGVTNTAAVLCFAATGLVRWPEALTMLIGAVIGGYWGARGARHLNPYRLRAGITVFNVAMTAIFFIRGLK